MNRYVFPAVMLAAIAAPELAQAQITGAPPPWAPVDLIPPPLPLVRPRTPFTLTDQTLATLKNLNVSESVLLRLAPLKGKVLTQEEFQIEIRRILTPDESTVLRQLIWSLGQNLTPGFVQVPSGKPLVGYYKMDAVLVGADGHYPFDSGEFMLAGLQGNARIFGTFTITMPPPADVDPLNQAVPYKSCRGLCNRPCEK